MDHSERTGFGIDPLGDVEVQRALALARARESYPAVPRETLLGYCEAAWAVALKADPRGHDLQDSFDRALLIIAWTQRRSGGRVPLRDLVDQTVPRVALEPFISERIAPPVGEELVLGEAAEEPSSSRRPLLRVPFTSPLPVGAAIAAGFVGLAILNETEVLPIAPLQPTGSENAPTGTDKADRADGSRGHAASDSAATAADAGPTLGSASVLGSLSDAAAQAHAGAVGAQHAAAEAPSGSADRLVTGNERSAVSAKSAGESVIAAAAPVPAAETAPAAEGPATPAPTPAPQPVVRIQMPPPAMVVEVSVPPSRTEHPAEHGDEDSPGENAPTEPDDAPNADDPSDLGERAGGDEDGGSDGGDENDRGGDEWRGGDGWERRSDRLENTPVAQPEGDGTAAPETPTPRVRPAPPAVPAAPVAPAPPATPAPPGPSADPASPVAPAPPANPAAPAADPAPPPA
jgi:hypothetical protein